MDFARRERRSIGLNLTSLIDVMLLLVIFFMLTASFEHVESMEVTFPSSAMPVASDEQPMVVVVAERGRLFVDNQKLELSALAGTVTEGLKMTPSRRILVMNTEGVSVQELISVMDAIHQAGAENVSLSSWKY